MPARYLSSKELRAFYDRFGIKQDWQRFYEGPAMRELIAHARLYAAKSVFELGFGTGAFALELLQKHLPKSATYTGVDISSTMYGIAEKRLARFAGRARIELTDGSLVFDFPDAEFDRFFANYVLDLLPPDDISSVINEAHRLLKPGGLMCLLSLTHGTGPLSRAIIRAWSRLFRLSPGLVGGCRPVRLTDYLDAGKWRIAHHDVLSPFAVSSEVVVAERVG